MNDNTGRHYRPRQDQDIDLMHAVTPWTASRLMDTDADWLLQACFPGWAATDDLLAHSIWKTVFHDLLLETGVAVGLVWRSLHRKGGRTRLFCHATPSTRRLVVVLDDGAGGHSVNVFLRELVHQELVRQRQKQDGSQDPFCLLDIIREEYENATPKERKETTVSGVQTMSLALTQSWIPNLYDALADKLVVELPPLPDA